MGPSPNQVLLFHALHNQMVVSSQLILISKDHFYAFLDGTLDEGLRLRANPYLSHGANLWGRAQGKQHMVLGGGFSGEDSLLRYKQRYAPNRSVLFSVGSKIFHHDGYQAMIDRRAAWERELGISGRPLVNFSPPIAGECSPLLRRNDMLSEAIIRSAGPGDSEAIAALMLETASEQVRRITILGSQYLARFIADELAGNKNDTYVMCTVRERVVGMCAWRHGDTALHLNYISVVPDMNRRHILQAVPVSL